MTFHVPEQYRLSTGIMKSDESYGNNGCFEIPFIKPSDGHVAVGKTRILACIASDGMDYEHVSVYKIIRLGSQPAQRKIPSWDDMCFIKDMFWDDEDCVIQYHPPKSEYVNNNPFVLHLWRPIGVEIPQPPRVLV